jgi:hypothetical protein
VTDHLRNRQRGAQATLATLLALGAAIVMLAPPPALADGNKFTWSKNGNTAEVYWRSFLDDAAYMTVNATARQRRGKNTMYVKIDFYALRCAAGMNTCYSIGAGGVVSLGEGAEWHLIGHNRLPDMPRKRSRRFAASQPLDPNSTLMQSRTYLCYDRSITPDPCSRTRYGTLKYNSG